MRILIPIHGFGPGGVERVALLLADEWALAGAEVAVVVGRDAVADYSRPTHAACDVLSVGSDWTARFETLWMILRLPGRVRRFQPDVVFCPGNTYAIVAAALKLLLGSACPPIVLKVSNDLGARRYPNPLARGLYRLWTRVQGRIVDHFVAIAAPLRDEVAAATGAPAWRVSVVPDPLLRRGDLAALASRPDDRSDRDGGSRHFVSVGRLASQKNHTLLVRAFARSAGLADTLTILGEGPERSRLCRLADALGVCGRVNLPGHVADIAPWLLDADLFVLASDYEGTPGALVEALAAGLPIVATESSAAIPDLLGHGAYGRLVPVGDEAALTAALADPPTTDREGAMRHAARYGLEEGAAELLWLFAFVAAGASLPWRPASAAPLPSGPSA